MLFASGLNRSLSGDIDVHDGDNFTVEYLMNTYYMGEIQQNKHADLSSQIGIWSAL